MSASTTMTEEQMTGVTKLVEELGKLAEKAKGVNAKDPKVKVLTELHEKFESIQGKLKVGETPIAEYKVAATKLAEAVKTARSTAASVKEPEEDEDEGEEGADWKISGKITYNEEINAKANKAALKDWEDFEKLLKQKKKHPKAIAEELNLEYKGLQGSKSQIELKLTGKQRATFVVNAKSQTLTSVHVGGHT